MPTFDGIDFTGPVGIDGLPSGPGVYIITTPASGGIKVLGAYEAEDMCQSAGTNPKRPCWEKRSRDVDDATYRHAGTGPAAYYHPESDPQRRASMVIDIMYRSFYGLECNDPVKDDF